MNCWSFILKDERISDQVLITSNSDCFTPNMKALDLPKRQLFTSRHGAKSQKTSSLHWIPIFNLGYSYHYAETPWQLSLQDGDCGIIITSAHQTLRRVTTVRCLDMPSHGTLHRKSNLRVDCWGGGRADITLTAVSCDWVLHIRVKVSREK